jgi:hypothetical protein
MTGSQRTRTLKRLVLRTVVLRVAGFGVVASVLGLGHAMALQPSADPSASLVDRVADAPPTWTPADVSAFPGCVALAAWPSWKPAPSLVGQSVREDIHRRIGFDRAWRLNHNETETDDVWVLGVCAQT